MTLSKNLNALRLAGLLSESEALRQQGLLVEQDPTAPPPDAGAGMGSPDAGSTPDAGGAPSADDKPEDPAILLDKAIDLLNKIKETMSGGKTDAQSPTPPPQGF
jgi:hypothetical protein